MNAKISNKAATLVIVVLLAVIGVGFYYTWFYAGRIEGKSPAEVALEEQAKSGKKPSSAPAPRPSTGLPPGVRMPPGANKAPNANKASGTDKAGMAAPQNQAQGGPGHGQNH